MPEIEQRARDLQRVRAAHPNNPTGSLAAVKPKPGPMIPSDRLPARAGGL
ncbi:hypothetical protein V8017_11425 [Stenotrophomonas rhizophila]